MEIKPTVEKYNEIPPLNKNKTSVPEFNHPTNKKLTGEQISKIVKRHTNQIKGTTEKQRKISIEIEETKRQFIAMKRWFWVFIGAA